MSEDKFEPSLEYKQMEYATKKLRKDIVTARGIIRDGITRYKKKQLRARSKKEVEDMSVFAVLDDYNTREQIQDDYGWEFITEAEMDRRMHLWDMREQHVKESGRYSDPVTEMLERAMNGIGEEHFDTIREFDTLEKRRNEDIKRIEQANAENDYKRYIASLK